MDKNLYSNAELSALREKLNAQIKRRGTFTWWDPLVPPTVGTDREARRVLPEGSEGEVVTDKTYVVRSPSGGSLEPTRSEFYPAQGTNPGGQATDDVGNPKTSAVRLDQDEIKNMILGIAKLHDIDLFYGRDEKAGLAFRDPADIQAKLELAEQDKLHEDNIEPVKRYDPNAGMTSMINPGYDFYPMGNTYMDVTQPPQLPSGQYDGEELLPGHAEPDPTNFYDDYGAKVEPTTVGELTSADRQVIPVEHDGYKPAVRPEHLTAELDLTPGRGKLVTAKHLIDRTATSGTMDHTPGGKASGGWIPTPGGTPAITLPGQPIRRSYNGGADRMVDSVTEPGKTSYSGHHPTTGGPEVTDKNVVPPLSFPNGAKGDQAKLAFHPQNPYVSPTTTVFQVEQDDQRHETVTEVTEGDKNSIRFGTNPRNPQKGREYSRNSYRQSHTGVKGLCHVACSGMCYLTCDGECDESCQTTCWNRCGDACVSECTNVCTGCSTLCYTSCRTKCETASGVSCVNAGAETAQFISDGSPSGGGAWPHNRIKYSLHSCDGCSSSCQFYANYRTTCWDALCQNMCFYSCYSYCSTSCYGGCIDNQSQHNFSKDPDQPKNSMATNSARYRTGRGQACREGCVADCVGVCQGSCDGECTTGCFSSKCVNSCYDTCDSGCDTHCGEACASVCSGSCSGDCNSSCDTACNSSCYIDCENTCKGSCEGSCSGSCDGGCDGSDGSRAAFEVSGKEDGEDE